MKAADETPVIRVDRRASREARLAKETGATAEKGSRLYGAAPLRPPWVNTSFDNKAGGYQK